MSVISAALVKELREKTGAGMMDCKKALSEVSGNIEEAVDWLRKKGLAASKKAGRIATEGLVGVFEKGYLGSIVEINSETDFVARNPLFQDFVRRVAELASQKDYTVESLAKAAYDGDATIESELTRLIGVIGENMTIRRVQKQSVSKGVVCSYVHAAVAPQVGRIGVLVALESEADAESLRDLGKKLAMHIAAATPQAIRIEEVDPSNLERERTILIDQAKQSGRPDEVIQKMVEGRVRKYYEEVVLLEQAFVMDGKTKISDVIAQKEKELGHSILLKGFERFALGEGIEKEVTDFAAEVKAQAQK